MFDILNLFKAPSQSGRMGLQYEEHMTMDHASIIYR